MKRIDQFHRKAKQDGFRARSAFKLLDIQRDYDIFKDVKNVVDLCAAPGSWSQVLSQNIKGEGRLIVSVDLQDMSPIPGVKIIKGDITKKETAMKIISSLEGNQADLVICDGAPDGIN